MKLLKDKNKGWAIASMNDDSVLSFTFARTKKESINLFMKMWNNADWKEFQKQGFKVVEIK